MLVAHDFGGEGNLVVLCTPIERGGEDVEMVIFHWFDCKMVCSDLLSIGLSLTLQKVLALLHARVLCALFGVLHRCDAYRVKRGRVLGSTYCLSLSSCAPMMVHF